MTAPNVGAAEVTIRPNTTAFEAQLRSQLLPIVNRVAAQLAPAFAQAGSAAATSFNTAFARDLSRRLSLTGAVPAQEATRAGQQVAAQFGEGLRREAEPRISRGLVDGAARAVRQSEGRFRGEGERSGRVFGTGFGEGFAALAAFAIARRIGLFFRETVASATQFETSFAGVRRVLDGTPEQFERVRNSIVGMSEALPFAASNIADTVAEAGRLGVGVEFIEEFTETVLKFATITGQAPEAAANSFAKFATVTKTSLGDVEALADVILRLGTQFVASEAEVLEFSRRLTPLKEVAGVASEEILGLATALVQVGGRAESGGTAVSQTFALMQAAAEEGGNAALKFAAVIGEDTVGAFQELLREDPAEAFVRLLEGLQSQGAAATGVLDDLGLGSVRVRTALLQLASSGDVIRDTFQAATTATGELDEQFSIFAATAAARMQVLSNRIENTRIEIGGKLAPAIIGVLGPVSQLDTTTVALTASFAALAAAGFAFQRFRNIFQEFSTTLGGARLSAQEMGIGMQIAQTQGTSLANVLRIVKQEEISLVEAQRLLAQGNNDLTARFAANRQAGLSMAEAYRLAKTEAAQLAVAQRALAVTPPPLPVGAPTVAGPPLPPQAAAGVTQATRQLRLFGDAVDDVAPALPGLSRGFLQSGRDAIAAAGGFGQLLSALGRASIFLFVADLATQAAVGITGFFDSLARGEQDIEATENALLGLVAGTKELNEVLAAGRVEATGFGAVLDSVATSGLNFAANVPAEAVRLIGRAAEDTGIPGLEQLGRAAAGTASTIQDAFNRIPLIGRIITTETEAVEARFEDIEQALLRTLGTAPDTAQRAFALLKDRLLETGEPLSNINTGFADFISAAENAGDKANILGLNAEQVVERLVALGASEDVARAEAEAMGFAFDNAAGSLGGIISAADAAGSVLNRLFQAQTAFQARVQGLTLTVGGLASMQSKASKAAGGAAKDTRAAARRIADAEEALAEAREDAAERIAEAERRLAEAEEDAIRRVIAARRELDESRRDSTRRLRDSQQDLQDFQAALDRVGGAQTPEDIIRLRELQEAVSDAAADARFAELEGQREVTEAEEEGADRVAEARRKLAEAHEDGAERIADALEKIARAHEDAAAKSGAAAAKMSDAVNLSVSQMIAGFQKQARELNTFSRLMTDAAAAIQANFPAGGFADAFLADLAELGPKAIPTLRSIVGASDEEIGKLGAVFKKQIKAAKKAADFEFAKFPPNFQQAIKPAVANIVTEMGKFIGTFDSLTDKSGNAATAIGVDLQNLTTEFLLLAQEAGGQLNPVIASMLELADSAKTPVDRVKRLKDLIDGLKSKRIAITADLAFDIDTEKLEKELKVLFPDNAFSFGKFGKTITGPLANLKKAQFGFTSPAGFPMLVGKHTAEELFIPSTAGAVFKHSDTLRILEALKGARGGNTQFINVNEVANDPRATARAVSFAVGSDGAIR